MKYVRHIVIPFLFLAAYYITGLGFASRIEDGVMVTLIVDLVFGFGFWFYYRKKIKNCSRSVSKLQAVVLVPLLYAFWMVTQVTASCISMIPDLGWEQHASAAIVDAGTYVILTVIGAPLLEEVLFRGVIYRNLKKLWGIGIAIFISSFVFGLTHGNLPQFYVGFMAGLLFGLVYECSGRMWVAILIHAVYNGWTTSMSSIMTVPRWMLTPWFLIIGNFLVLFVLIFGFVKYGSDKEDGLQGQMQDALDVKDKEPDHAVRAGEEVVLPEGFGLEAAYAEPVELLEQGRESGI